MRKYFVFSLILLFVFPLAVLAGIGVGVGAGKIEVNEPLKPGGIYEITSLPVLNTGNEPSDYEILVTYHADQSQQRPPREWFSFYPSSFYLEPGKSQMVIVKITLPVKAKPGDYFGYLEARPVVPTGSGTNIGIAAATKLYFSVTPANFFQGIYYRLAFLWAKYAPWTWIVLAMVIAVLLIIIFRKFFSLQIGIKKK